MLACVDVDYRDVGAVAACVAFERWGSPEPAQIAIEEIEEVAPYVPGEFYRRELPCVLAVLARLDAWPETVIVDGHVWLRNALVETFATFTG